MTMNDETPFEGFEETGINPEPAAPAPQKNNKNFLIAIGVIGGILVLAVIAVIVVIWTQAPQRSAEIRETSAYINAMNTATSVGATSQVQTVQANANSLQQTLEAGLKATATKTKAVIASATTTPVLAQLTATPTEGPKGGVGSGTLSPTEAWSHTATVAALQTKFPEPTKATQATALPSTGFADEVGLPALGLIAAVLVVVIIAARRLRTSH